MAFGKNDKVVELLQSVAAAAADDDDNFYCVSMFRMTMFLSCWRCHC